jgi:hypothetical protein
MPRREKIDGIISSIDFNTDFWRKSNQYPNLFKYVKRAAVMRIIIENNLEDIT